MEFSIIYNIKVYRRVESITATADTMVVYIIALVLILTLLYTFTLGEKFTSKREKAQKIHEWFSSTGSHKYTDYRGALERQSNIVEFEDVKKLFDSKNFTISAVESVL